MGFVGGWDIDVVLGVTVEVPFHPWLREEYGSNWAM
jgi:hypothetical protein